ncbi:hypothetical protein SDC9_183634 [bioreactor metagenome]|uniref:Uncharacterized protein n=1 Tax=bioreactor metagenome TaxID=1076179 RepID=A0A645HAS4_9ZZZZ
MLGRGILANPGLVGLIKDNLQLDKKLLKAFHDELLDNYMELYKDKNIAMLRMKELWTYMLYIFSDNKKYGKKIKKSQDLNDYKSAVFTLFEEQEIIKGAGLFHTEF